jgi:hypothetical protein
MTSPYLPFLQSDRIIFKLFAWEDHLKNIKNIKLQHGDLLSNDARVNAEMEIDSLISQIIGTVDSLLFRIIGCNTRNALGQRTQNVCDD